MADEITAAAAGIANTSALTQTKKSSDISMDDFLKILAASMSNPSMGGSDSSGGGSTDYISQLVQFTTLESLNELSETLTTSVILQQQQQAFSLINKQVTLMDGTETLSGTIEKVRFANGYATIVVNGKVSNHAQKRLTARELTLQDDDYQSLSTALSELAEKGSKESLLVYKEMGLIADVHSRTIITAMGMNELHTVTNIDSATFIK